MTRPKYSIVAPVFNEEETLPVFYERMAGVMERLDGPCELVLVFDGSRDKSPEIGRQLRENDPRIKIIDFARNFGHQIAITAGIDYAEGDAVAIIDSDLQDPPEVILDLAAKWQEGYVAAKWQEGYEVIYAQRRKRAGETFFKLFTAAAFYRLIRSMASIEIPQDTGDFRLIDRKVVLVMRQLREHHRFMRGLSVWVGAVGLGRVQADRRALRSA